MKLRTFVFSAVFTTALLVLSACTGGDTQPSDEPSSEEPIRIGISLPLTGNRGDAGTAANNGYEVWASIVNDNGGMLGRPVELVILDSESDQDKAVADYEQLITVDAVDLVLGTQSSFLVVPTSQVASEYGYAYVEPAGGAPEVFNRGLDNVFFAQPASGARQGDPFARYIFGLPDDQRPTTFAVVVKEDDFTLGVTDRLTELLTEGGLEMVYRATYTEETDDWSDIAAELVELDPDLIVGGTNVTDSIGQILAYVEAGYQPRVAYFTSGPSLPDAFRTGLGEATEGVFSSVSWFSEAKGFQNAEFVERYIEMFGGDLATVPEDAANAFTAGQVLEQAVANIESIDNAALIDELHRATFDTVVGSLSFDETGAPQGSFMLLQWQGDTYVIVGPLDRAETDPIPPPKPEW